MKFSLSPDAAPVLVGAAALFLGTANPLIHVPLIIVGYPAALAWLGLTSPRPFRHGWWAGLLGATGGLYWIAVAVHDYGFFPWVAAASCAAVLGMYVGLWGGLFSRAAAALRPLGPVRRCVAAGLLWYLLEWIRGWFGTGFPWLTLSGGLAAWPELVQGASLAGEYGLSGLLAGAGWLLAETALAARRGDFPRCRRTGGAALLVLLLPAVFGWCRVHVVRPFPEPEEIAPLTVALVQGNVGQDIKWDPVFQQATVDKYLDLSRQALASAAGRPDIVIWPETSMPFHYQADDAHGSRLRAFARETGVPLLFGGPGFARNAPGETVLFNRAFLIDARGLDQGHYDKQHLVPLGEYAPPPLNLPIFEALTQGIGGFAPGSDAPPFRLDSPTASPGARLGMLICYEGIFPEIARQRVAQGATVLINISNDAWYNRTSAPTQHLQLSLLRAVEQGRWMARATNTGVTAFISPLGEITSSVGDPVTGSGLFTDAFLVGVVAPLSGHTVYFVLHPWLPSLAFLALAVIVWPVLPRRKRR